MWEVTQPTPAEVRAGKQHVRIGGRAVPNGTVFLDVVTPASNARNNAMAKQLGMRYYQHSAFDLGSFENVATGGMSYGKRSPSQLREARADRPSIYKRAGAELAADPVEKMRALLANPALTGPQREMVRQWLAEQEAVGQ